MDDLLIPVPGMIAKAYTRREASLLPPLVLAYIGDAVYELYVRSVLVARGVWKTNQLHKGSVGLVKASAQASIVRRIIELLTEEELTVYKRGRNAKGGNVPKGSTTTEYRMATGFEALVGYLYITGAGRLRFLLEQGLDETNENNRTVIQEEIKWQ